MNNVNTITLQINNEKAYKLIEDLEALNIVKVLKKGEELVKSNLSQKFAGALKLTISSIRIFKTR